MGTQKLDISAAGEAKAASAQIIFKSEDSKFSEELRLEEMAL